MLKQTITGMCGVMLSCVAGCGGGTPAGGSGSGAATASTPSGGSGGVNPPSLKASSGGGDEFATQREREGVESQLAVMNARNLTQEEVEALERALESNPEDMEARTKLVGYYSMGARRGGRQEQEKHMLWLIEHRPESPLAGMMTGQIDKILQPESYAKGRELWLKHCEEQPTNAAILDHASTYFLIHDRADAIRLVKQGRKLEPENPAWAKKLGQLLTFEAHGTTGHGGKDPAASSTDAFAAYEEALAKTTGMKRFYDLAPVAKAALAAGAHEKAKRYAKELLDMSLEVDRDWNYGNAVHHGNLVLGEVALAEGKVEEAEEFLLSAGKTPGSPQLNSFGPNMRLAKKLLEAGRKDAVIEYLDLCGKFWKMGKVNEWKKQIEAGGVPKFGGNLVY